MAELPQTETILGRPITHAQSLPVPAEEVWNLISRPGNLVDFHPFCERNPVEIWPGVGSRDVIHYYSGLVLVREFDAWFEGTGYDLTASADNGMQFKVYWRIQTGDNHHSSLTLTIKQVDQQLSEKKLEQYARLLNKYLQQVGQGLEYYLRTRERVTRNQFGSHRFFSPPIEKQNTE
jgi:hypothetical protein